MTFVILGGLLCAIIGIVGILNFFNAMMTAILARSREFAVLQSVGMTGRQLETMLLWEGLLYTLGSGLMGASVRRGEPHWRGGFWKAPTGSTAITTPSPRYWPCCPHLSCLAVPSRRSCTVRR